MTQGDRQRAAHGGVAWATTEDGVATVKMLSLPLLPARRRLAAVAAALLALVLCAPGVALPTAGSGDGTDVQQAGMAPLPFDPSLRFTDSDTPAAGQRPSLDPDEAVIDLEPVDPEAAPLRGARLQHPAIRLHGDHADDPEVLAAVRDVEGVSLATPVLHGSLTLSAGDDEVEVEVAAVDPESFRLLTPRVTAEAVDVWRRITEGDAAFVHEVGQGLQQEHGVALGDRIPLAGGALEGEEAVGEPSASEAAGHVGGLARPRAQGAPTRQRPSPARDETVRIGAYASNGAPPVAEVLISHETAEALDVAGERMIVVALEDGTDADEVAAQLAELTGLDAEVVPQPSTRRAFLSRGESRAAFEPFTYVSLGDGMIEIERDWVRHNIVSAQVPVFRGHVTCHRLMVPQLRGALQEIVDLGLDHLIDPGQYGGCWVPRHILFNPNRALSMHAWGLAIDFNVSTNQYGANPQLDRRIVEVFERWGFEWGGHWSTPDGMHFELAVLLAPEGE